MSFQAEVNLEMTVRISSRDQVTGADVLKLNALFAAVEALGGVINLPATDSDTGGSDSGSNTGGSDSGSNTGGSDSSLIQITDVNIYPNTVILKDAPNETKIQLIVTPSGANQAITVTDVSENNALQYLEYDAATRTISTRGQYAGRDATILVEWNGGSKQFTIPVQLYAQPQAV
ncbi:hypothetical protein [Acinetobacter brisouii]|uniref:hypothetical protein n=1 Tax=Acinetobacter brisouii TaxID=396323 RepID=UPI0012504049|nr:hypothetical protein [Acinetobacter brisouii]